MNGKNLNIQCIGTETHAAFDAFAEKVMEHQLVKYSTGLGNG